MPKKKTTHRKSKHSVLMAHHAAEYDHHGHHARLRKHQEAHAARHRVHGSPRHKKPRKALKGMQTSAAMDRLHKAVGVAKDQLRSVGARRKHHHAAEKQVTEKTLRDHMALKCVRRCSH